MSGPDSKNQRPHEPRHARAAKAKQQELLTGRLAKPEEALEGLSFARTLRERLACGVLILDRKRQVTAMTDRAKRLLGLPPDQAVMPAFEALPLQLQGLCLETLASGQAQPNRHVRLQAADGTAAVNLCVSAAPLNLGGNHSGVALVLNDLSPVQEFEERLQQLDRLANMGTLAAAMAHEIKNALVAGKTFVDLLLEKHQDAELVEVVRREMGRIDAIVSRMLNFGGPVSPRFSEVRLHEILDHSLHLVQSQLEGKLVSLNRSFQAAPDMVKGDDCLLQQAFVNLFLNALEAMGPKGTLSVVTESVSPDGEAGWAAASPPPSQLRVRIEDTGEGIPPENLARLFEPFFTTKADGTGLGLPITRRIILEHQGQISVESRPGQGTAFHILLPAAA